MPEILPQIEFLEILHCTGLDITMVAELIPKMKMLRRISLPSSLMTKDRALTRKITEDFLNREEPIQIIDFSYVEYNTCLFQLV